MQDFTFSCRDTSNGYYGTASKYGALPILSKLLESKNFLESHRKMSLEYPALGSDQVYFSPFPLVPGVPIVYVCNISEINRITEEPMVISTTPMEEIDPENIAPIQQMQISLQNGRLVSYKTPGIASCLTVPVVSAEGIREKNVPPGKPSQRTGHQARNNKQPEIRREGLSSLSTDADTTKPQAQSKRKVTLADANGDPVLPQQEEAAEHRAAAAALDNILSLKRPPGVSDQVKLLEPLGWEVLVQKGRGTVEGGRELEWSYMQYFHKSYSSKKHDFNLCFWRWQDLVGSFRATRNGNPRVPGERPTLDVSTAAAVSKHLQFLASTCSYFGEVYPILRQLGWRKVSADVLGKSASSRKKDEVYLPNWTVLANRPDDNMELVENCDFFWDDNTDVIAHLRVHGNQKPPAAPADAATSSVVGSHRKRQKPVDLEDPQRNDADYQYNRENIPKLIYLWMKNRRHLPPTSTYGFGELWEYLKILGWEWQSLPTSLGYAGNVMVPYWAMANFDKKKFSKLVKNRDFFECNEDVIRYIQKHGLEPTDAAVTPEDKRRRTTASVKNVSSEPTTVLASARKKLKIEAPAPPPAPAPAPLPEAAAQKQGAATPGKKSGAARKSTLVAEQQQMEARRAALLQIRAQVERAGAETRAEPVPESLPFFDYAAQKLVKLASNPGKQRRRLRLRSYLEVWSCLAEFGWHWFYGNLREIYTYESDLKRELQLSKYVEGVHYFTSKQSVLDFVKGQIRARGHNYEMLSAIAENCDDDDGESDSDFPTSPMSDTDVSCGASVRGLLPRNSLDRAEDPCSHVDRIVGAQCSVSPRVGNSSSSSYGSGKSPSVSADANVSPFQFMANSVSVGVDNRSDRSMSQRGRRGQARQNDGASVAAESRTHEVVQEVAPTTEDTREAALARFDAAREKLRPGYDPTTAIGREAEMENIAARISRFLLQDSSGGSILISGSPGRGKTCTVKCIRDLIHRTIPSTRTTHRGEVETIYHMEIFNGVELPREKFWSVMHASHCMDEQPMSEERSMERILRYWAGEAGEEAPRSGLSVLVLDEMDKCSTFHINNIIAAANSKNSRLLFVGLSNTVGGLASFGGDRDSATLAAAVKETIVFRQYDAPQVLSILKDRVGNVFDDKAVEYLVGKSKQSGDVRQMLQIAERCISFWRGRLLDQSTEFKAPANFKPFAIDMPGVVSVMRLADPDPAQQQLAMVEGLPSDARCLLVAALCYETQSNTSERALVSSADLTSMCNDYRRCRRLPLSLDEDLAIGAVQTLVWAKLLQPRSKNDDPLDPKTKYRLTILPETMMKSTKLEALHKAALSDILASRCSK